MAPRIRVLIADDQRSVRGALKCLLALSPQIEVIGEAGDGQSALRLVTERHPDVVVLDVEMPVMDGLEATRRIKDRWPGVRVVILTMYAKYRHEALAAGADTFLVKGCACEVLQKAMLARPGKGRRLQPAREELSARE